DLETGRFFMRVVFQAGGDRFPTDTDALQAAFAPVAERFVLDWALVDAAAKPRAIIAVSKGSHCLADLLHRRQSNALSIEIAGVVGNHEALRALTEWHRIAFHHLPVTDANRAEQEDAIATLMAATQADYLVLARYMQV